MKCKEIRFEAKQKCMKNSGTLAVITLIFSLLNGLASFTIETENAAVAAFASLVSIAGLIIYGAIAYGYTFVIRKNFNMQTVEVNDLFVGFKDFSKAFVISLLQWLYVFLWSLLFVIPGIIKGLAYSMSYYVALDNPNLKANECITKSKELMKGHKWELFCLMFSYIGWLILCVLTLGILSFWVTPKMHTATYILYKIITKQDAPAEEAEIA